MQSHRTEERKSHLILIVCAFSYFCFSTHNAYKDEVKPIQIHERTKTHTYTQARTHKQSYRLPYIFARIPTSRRIFRTIYDELCDVYVQAHTNHCDKYTGSVVFNALVSVIRNGSIVPMYLYDIIHRYIPNVYFQLIFTTVQCH